MAKFQSLSGFQVRCNSQLRSMAVSRKLSFNPYRVFKFVATPARHACFWPRPPSFNPYRVFKFVATSGDVIDGPASEPVSIPIGFSSSLQPHLHSEGNKGFNVSIPIGFSSSLQQTGSGFIYHAIHQFQSLSGFQVRCNSVEPVSLHEIAMFQSLSGFQVRCNATTGIRTTTQRVSIPIGFSSSLQQNGQLLHLGEIQGFNPYRVFKFVATFSAATFPTVISRFQSLSGFQVRCNGGDDS